LLGGTPVDMFFNYQKVIFTMMENEEQENSAGEK